MSHPRISVPGGTFMVTRTTAMGLFLLVPGDVVNQIMEYCLAWALQGRAILLHAVSVESTHFHLVLTDPNGELSEFIGAQAKDVPSVWTRRYGPGASHHTPTALRVRGPAEPRFRPWKVGGLRPFRGVVGYRYSHR